ncbi:MAG: hypothetical protein ABJO36_01570 [Litorimonas sp.]
MNSDAEEKHFKVVYGKVLGIPVGTATPITEEGHSILGKYFVPAFLLIGLSVFGSRLSDDPGSTLILFMAGWFGAAFTGFLFCRQLKKTGEFHREYFFKKKRNKKNEKN